MSQRNLNWRLALMVAGAVLAVFWGLNQRGDPYVIAIEFGATDDVLIGAEVIIDGEVAGTLKKMGARTQTGFRVSEGHHEVTIRSPDLGSDTVEVTTGFGGSRVLLMANFGERLAGDGRSTETYITLY